MTKPIVNAQTADTFNHGYRYGVMRVVELLEALLREHEAFEAGTVEDKQRNAGSIYALAYALEEIGKL